MEFNIECREIQTLFELNPVEDLVAKEHFVKYLTLNWEHTPAWLLMLGLGLDWQWKLSELLNERVVLEV